MKHIEKNIKNEPAALRVYRQTTPNATYKGYTDRDLETGLENPLKNALLKEQGYLCAYCMGRISLERNENGKPKIEVEHYLSQFKADAENKENTESLSYTNMLGVCNGLSITYPEKETLHHCDKTSGKDGKMNGEVSLRKLDPRDRSCEQILTYNLNGKILTVPPNQQDIEHDLEIVLNLNNSVLCKRRSASIDAIKEKMKKDKPVGTWDKRFISKYLDEYSKPDRDGKLRPYYMVIIWFLKELLRKVL